MLFILKTDRIGPIIDLLKVLFPELLITHFDSAKHEINKDVLHLHFEEKNDIPKEFSSRILILHGFHKEVTIQDFPVRGKKLQRHYRDYLSEFKEWKDKPHVKDWLAFPENMSK